MSEEKTQINFVDDYTQAEYVMAYIKHNKRVTFFEENEDGYEFILENMLITVNFKEQYYRCSRWGIQGNLDNLYDAILCIEDSIEFAETFGILDKDSYLRQVWLCIGW